VWEPGQVEWFVDGQSYFVVETASYKSSYYDKDYYLILKLSVGEKLFGYGPDSYVEAPESSSFPAEMLVDYVRVWEKDVSEVDVGFQPDFTVTSGVADVLASGEATNDNTLALSGSVPSKYSIVKVFDGVNSLGSAVVQNGQWSFDTSTLSDGNHTLSVSVEDVGGAVILSNELVVKVDTSGPVITLPDTGSLDQVLGLPQYFVTVPEGESFVFGLSLGQMQGFSSYASDSSRNVIEVTFPLVKQDVSVSDASGLSDL